MIVKHPRSSGARRICQPETRFLRENRFPQLLLTTFACTPFIGCVPKTSVEKEGNHEGCLYHLGNVGAILVAAFSLPL